jgi:dTDP-4-dehydrorhamnose 3,5-epimerase
VEVHTTDLEGVVVVVPRRFVDDRGFFFESWNQQVFDDAVGAHVGFVQDNHSMSRRGVLRGLHYQLPQAQGKLVRCVVGSVFDVAVDLRRSSATFGRWFGIELDAEGGQQLWMPPGFAHGFLTISDTAEVLYKATSFYDPGSEHTIRWDDPTLAIEWPPVGEVIVTAKDGAGSSLGDAAVFD